MQALPHASEGNNRNAAGSSSPPAPLHLPQPYPEVIDLTLEPSSPPNTNASTHERRRLFPSHPSSSRLHPGPSRRPHNHGLQSRRPANAEPPEVIDLEAMPEAPTRRPVDDRPQYHLPSPSPGDFEVTFAHARLRPSQSPFNPPPNPNQPMGGAGQNGGFDGNFPPVFNSPFRNDGFWNMFEQVAQNFRFPPLMNPPHAPVPAFRGPHFHRQGPQIGHFQAPQGLDYGLRAQIYPMRNQDDHPEIGATVNAKDKPIPPARAGFTRSPTSEDTIVCSDCEQELGNSDDEIKKQIWVAKCGHCYCGECAQKLLTSPAARTGRSSRGKKATKSCAVNGCRASFTTKKFIWEVYV